MQSHMRNSSGYSPIYRVNSPTMKIEYPPPTSGTTEQEIRNGFLLFFCKK